VLFANKTERSSIFSAISVNFLLKRPTLEFIRNSKNSAVPIASYNRPHPKLIPPPFQATTVPIPSYYRPHSKLLPSPFQATTVPIPSYYRPHSKLLPSPFQATIVPIPSYNRYHPNVSINFHFHPYKKGGPALLSRYSHWLQVRRSGTESRWGRDSPHHSRPSLGPTQPPLHCVPRLFPGGKAAGAGVGHPPHLAPRLKKE